MKWRHKQLLRTAKVSYILLSVPLGCAMIKKGIGFPVPFFMFQMKKTCHRFTYDRFFGELSLLRLLCLFTQRDSH